MQSVRNPDARATYRGVLLPPLDWKPLPERTEAILRHDYPDWSYALAKTPEDALADAELAQTVHEAIDDLKPRFRRAIELYFWEGHTLTEAGKILGVSQERFRQILWQGVSNLRKGASLKALHRLMFPPDWNYKPAPCAEVRFEPIKQYWRPIGPLPAPVEYPETLPPRYVKALALMRSLKGKQLDKVREYYSGSFGQVDTSKRPPILDDIERIVNKLTKAENRQVRDFIGQCRDDDCNGDAGKYGYCEYHHNALFGFGYAYRDRYPRTFALRTYPLTHKRR